MSTLSAVKKLIEMLYSFFKWRTSRCRKLQRKIEMVDRELASALRDGRVTDANKLAADRRKLYESFRGCPDNMEDEDE